MRRTCILLDEQFEHPIQVDGDKMIGHGLREVRFDDKTTKKTSIKLQMKPCGSSMSQLYFTDGNDDLLHIPKDIAIYMFDPETSDRILYRPLEISQRYILSPLNDYEIEYDKRLILSLSAQKCWKLTIAQAV
jgi:hypothetical protein